jgi:hypothetical protein
MKLTCAWHPWSIADSKPSWTPPGSGKRYDPLPTFLRLPQRGWQMLGRSGRIALAVLAAAGVAALVLSWPSLEREREAGERERARETRAALAAQRRALIEDQRPRRATLSPAVRDRIRAAGGLTDPGAAALVAVPLETAIARDVRGRVRADKLEGPVLNSRCDPVSVRSRLGANYNCFVLTNRRSSLGRTYRSGYRFSGRAQLPAGTLAWCKENPRPLHPTTYVVSVPISPDCR